MFPFKEIHQNQIKSSKPYIMHLFTSYQTNGKVNQYATDPSLQLFHQIYSSHKNTYPPPKCQLNHNPTFIYDQPYKIGHQFLSQKPTGCNKLLCSTKISTSHYIQSVTLPKISAQVIIYAIYILD